MITLNKINYEIHLLLNLLMTDEIRKGLLRLTCGIHDFGYEIKIIS
jgi:hypothetical protein